MKKKRYGKEFYICDYCGGITFDNFAISTIFRPGVYKHLHIRCLEKVVGRPLDMFDLTINPMNFRFLTHYSIWIPGCKYRKKERCKIDKRPCNGWCHFKTESKHRIEGMLLIHGIRRRNKR